MVSAPPPIAAATGLSDVELAKRFGAAVWRGKTWPRWQAGFAWLAGAIAVGIAIVSGEATPNLLYGAQGVVVAWCAVAGVRLLV